MKEEYFSKDQIAYAFLYYHFVDNYKIPEVPDISIHLTDKDLLKLDNLYNYIAAKYFDVGLNKTLKEVLEEKSDYHLYINDIDEYIDLYKEIVEKYMDFYCYGSGIDPLMLACETFQSVQLRMGIDDFNNPIKFLRNQVAFMNDQTFYEFNQPTIVDKFYDYDIEVLHMRGSVWDETFNKLRFYLFKDGVPVLSLFDILYGINDDTVYIYGIQKNKENLNDKKARRILYKINGNTTLKDVEPGKLLSLMTFIKLLDKNKIKYIKIPLMQVLNYDYHVRFSNSRKNEYLEAVEELKKKDNLYYRRIVDLYSGLIDKQDLISKIKTEKLYEVMDSVIERNNDVHLVNDVYTAENELIYRLK